MDIATLGIKVDSKGVLHATKNLDKLEKQGKAAERATDSLGKSTLMLAKKMGAVAIAGLAMKKVLNVNREMESLRTSLKTITGSAKNATIAFKGIQDFAATTPYSVQQVTQAFIKLGALGLAPSERALISYGNTASAMGKPLNQMIEAVADATTGEMERLKEFGIKTKTNGDLISFTFNNVTTTVAKNAKEIEGYLMAIGENKFGGAMAEQAKTLDGAFSNLGDSFNTLLDNFLGSTGSGRIGSAINFISESMRDLANIIADTEPDANKAAMTFDELANSLGGTAKAGEKTAKELKEIADAAEDLKKETKKLKEEDLELVAALKLEQKQLSQTDQQILLSNNLRELSVHATEDQILAVTNLTNAIFEEEKAIEEAAQKATASQQKFDDMANGMSTSFKATFREMLDGGDNVFRNLVDSAKAMVKDILSEMALLAAKPFIMRIAGVASMGASGMANAASGFSGGGGGMDMMSSLSSLSSLSGNSIGQAFVGAGNFMSTGVTTTQAYGAGGGAFTGAGAISNLVYAGVGLVAGLIGQELFGKNGGTGASIGATIGMAAGGLPGAIVGGLIGGALGGMIGPDAPSERFAISTGSNVGGHTGNLPMDEAIAKYGNQSDPDGSNFAFTDTAFGKTFLNSRRVDLTAMQNMIQGADDAMASFLSSDEIASITETLDNAEHFASSKHSGNKAGTQFAAIFNRYQMVLGAIDEELVTLFDERANKENIGKLPVALAAINKDLKDQLGIFSGTFGSDSGSLGNTIAEAVALVDTYATENETLLDTYTRLSVETLSLTSSLDIMGISLNKSVDGMINFARELTEAAGGAETASALWRGYFTTFYTDQEKAIASLEEGTFKLNAFLKATELDGLGLSMANFRASFEDALSAGLSASQTVDWLAAGELIRQVDELANTGMTGKISTLVTAKNDLIDAYKREIESQEGLATSFRGLADGLRASAQGLLLSSLSPLTNAERFAAAEARFNSVNSRAQLGDADALADLATVSEQFLKESQQFNASGTAYTDDFNMVQAALLEAGATSDRAADAADRMVDQLNDQYSLIATSNGWLETINTSVLSLNQVMENFITQGGDLSAIGKANGAASVTMSNAQFVDQLYTSGFNRQGDQEGVAYWNAALNNGATRQQIVDNFVSSAESANVGFDLANIKLFAKGGVSNRPAIFGESGAEAAVPLPDGRSIPVTLDKSIEQAIERMAIRVVAAVQGTTQAVNDSSNDAQSSANRVQAVR